MRTWGGYFCTIEELLSMAVTQQEVPWKNWFWQKRKTQNGQFKSWLEDVNHNLVKEDFFKLSLKMGLGSSCIRRGFSRHFRSTWKRTQLASNYLHFDIKHATNRLCVETRCDLYLRLLLPLSLNTPLLYHQEEYDGNEIKIFHKCVKCLIHIKRDRRPLWQSYTVFSVFVSSLHSKRYNVLHRFYFLSLLYIDYFSQYVQTAV